MCRDRQGKGKSSRCCVCVVWIAGKLPVWPSNQTLHAACMCLLPHPGQSWVTVLPPVQQRALLPQLVRHPQRIETPPGIGPQAQGRSLLPQLRGTLEHHHRHTKLQDDTCVLGGGLQLLHGSLCDTPTLTL